MKKLLFLVAVMLITIGMSVAQTSPNSSANPNGTAATQNTTTDQGTAATPSGNTADQNAAGTANTDQTGNATNNANSNSNANQLPQTASPLPLLALLGMGSLGTGLINRFRR